MERAVTYSVVARKKPNDLEGSAKYYALAQARGEMGIREMADRIQQMCTVTRADTMAVPEKSCVWATWVRFRSV